MAGARFCVECGRQVAESAGGSSGQAKAAAPKLPSTTGVQLTTAFIVVFLGITIVGLGAAAYLYLRPLTTEKNEMAAASPSAGAAGSSGQAGTQGAGSGQLPPGHPKVELPTEARTLIDKVEQDANAKPNDVDAWVKLGNVCMRAALFDQTYYQKASNAYAHVLKLEPDNLDALRGIGDIDFDQQHYDEAVAAYEHYLKRKPNDPEVLTDLGTMYLYTNNPDQAVVQYKKAIKIKPDLFQPYYNLGVAYGEQQDKGNAAIAFTKAISLAPDDDHRNQAKQAYTKYTGLPADQADKMAATLQNPTKPGTESKTPGATAGGTFHSAFEESVRSIPFMGDKVSAIDWPENYKAKVMMDNFPIDAMPPMAKDKFLNDLKARISSAKTAHRVTDTVEVDIVDSQSGRVMQSVTQ